MSYSGRLHERIVSIIFVLDVFDNFLYFGLNSKGICQFGNDSNLLQLNAVAFSACTGAYSPVV